MESNINRDLLSFIAASPTAWHTVENLAWELREAGYRELFEEDAWELEPGARCFVRRNDSSLLAFRVPEKPAPGFMLMTAHADSPTFKVKELETVTAAGVYAQLNVERYGGMMISPWLDRPLSVAGRVVFRDGERLVTRLVNIDRDLLLIPNLAIHLDRSANEGKAYDPKTDLMPLVGLEGGGVAFRRLIADAAGTQPDDILSAELMLYPRTPGTIWGAEGEFLSAPRLDDLQCVYACARGFLEAEEGRSIPVLCIFDNEEVGNGTKQGADSTFLEDSLQRLCEALDLGLSDYRRMLSQSLMVSADNAHAVHPNRPEFSDKIDRPVINSGVVIKYNAKQRYTTDALSAALFLEICRRAGVPTQRYSNRADITGGWTLGHISLTHVSLKSVDVGLAQLAMHSCYETAGTKDTDYLRRAAMRFFASSLRCRGDEMLLTDGGKTE